MGCAAPRDARSATTLHSTATDRVCDSQLEMWLRGLRTKWHERSLYERSESRVCEMTCTRANSIRQGRPLVPVLPSRQFHAQRQYSSVVNSQIAHSHTRHPPSVHPSPRPSPHQPQQGLRYHPVDGVSPDTTQFRCIPPPCPTQTLRALVPYRVRGGTCQKRMAISSYASCREMAPTTITA